MSEPMPDRSALSREEKLALLNRLARQKERAKRRFPLTFAQQRLWFLDRLDPGNHVNNIFRAVSWRGPLDAGVLGRVLSELVRRHESLRTTFPEVEGEPQQKVAPAAEFDLPMEDLTSLPLPEALRRARELAEEESRRGFDLARGPVFRARLLRLAAEEHVLLLAMHHIVSDGWSMGLLFHELTVLYRAFAAGLPSPLGEPEVQYADFAVWQRERLSDERLAEEVAWWRERLAGFPDYLELPSDRPRPAGGSFRGAIEPFAVPSELSEKLRALAIREGATPFMVLLAAFETLLYRLCGQEAFLVGTNVAGRKRTELEGVIGLFTEVLLLRARLDAGLTFGELLAQVRRDALDAQAHQDLPFERLVEELQPERHLSHNPLYQVQFVLQNLPGGAVELPGVELASLPIERGLAKLDLTLEMVERDGQFSGYFEYNTDLFDRATIARIAGYFLQLLAGIVGGIDRPLGELPLLSREERRRALAEWNPRFTGAPALVMERISEQARRAPEAPAVLFGNGALTYAELEAGANRLARGLRRLGVELDSPVGVCLERSLEMPMALLGILKAGGAWVPLDPSYPRERLAMIIEDAGLRVLLTTRGLAVGMPAGGARMVCLDDDAFAQEDPSAPRREIHPESLAYIIYTSGTTGRPKGVGVPHRSLANHAAACAERYGLRPDDRVLQFTSISFDITSEEIFPTWLAGGAVVPRPPGLFPSVSELYGLIERHGITIANLPTAYWHEWVSELVRTGEKPPAPLRMVVVGTEQALPERVAEWLEIAGNVRWINGYASTEATVTALTYEPAAADAPRLHAAQRVPVGKPIRNCRVYVLDATLEPVPVGVPGDVYIGGPNVSRGYLGWPDRTAASFVPDPFAEDLGYGPGQRLYRQGDRGRYLPDGTVECLGRSDFQVKVRGYRIEPGEIEAVAARHPVVEACVVLAHEDGPGNRRLVAYAAPRPGASLQAEELRSFLKESLPDYMVPAAFVVLGALPLNVNGKVDRRALAGLALAPEASAAEEAPRSPAEELIAAIWAELLHRDSVGLHDSFFDLGGHSLLAIQAISRLREALGAEVPLRTLFEKPTVAGIAAAIEAAGREEAGLVAPPVVPVPRDLPLACSFAQQRLWFLDKLLPGDPAYNIPVAVRFQGPMDRGLLGLALTELTRRHESLRTTFAAAPGGQPVQVVAAAPAAAVPPLVDLRGLPAERRESEAHDRLAEESLVAFDLARGPLLRPCLFRLDDEEVLLYFAVHHIICDGVSIAILLRELVTLYGAFARGAGSPLAKLPVQYADFAAWQRAWLQGEVLEKQVSYWRQQLAGAPAVIELPTDRPRPAVQSSHGARRHFRLPAALVQDLAVLGRRERCTPFMTFQAAFNALLGRYSGQEDVLVGWPIAGRNRAELEGVIGFLANILVLRTDLRGEPGFRQLLARVREASLGAYAHQDLPFEQLVEELRPERHLSHNPIFQVFFVLHPGGAAAPALPGVNVAVPSIDNGTTRGDLLVSLSEARDGLSGMVEYNTDLFDAATIERLAGHFVSLLQAVLADAETAVAALPILAADERRQIVETWNETAAPYPDLCVHQLFEAQSARSPEATALVFDADGESLTYGELNARANRLARRLRAAGVGPGALVGLCLERSPEMVVALLATLKAGGAYVPLDPTYPPDRLAFVLEDSGARVLLTQAELRYDLPAGDLEVIEVEPGAAFLADDSHEDARDLAPLAGPADLAYVIYTSGSTGRPKGVEVRHAGVVNFLTSMGLRPGLSAADALLAVTTISFDIAGLELYLPLAVGARIVLASRDTAADGARLAALLASSGATVLQATPATWRLLLAAGWSGAPRLKVLCGGEALPPDLAGELLARTESVWNVYGPTETTIWSTVEPVTAAPAGALPIGRPIANTAVHLLDRYLQPVPVGVAGELYIGGAGVARGYLRRPALTAERFVPDPFSPAPGARLYRTGDLARHLPDGRAVYLGRTDFQVKVRGFRIELGEIEAVLSRHPAVAQCVVAVREDTPGNPQIAAYYVAAEGRAASVGNLRAALREELPDYMIPSHFVALPALPLTPNGKVDRKALPAPDGGRPDLGREYVAPQGPVQEQLAAIWAEVLRRDRVGADDNFFELGGHSLMATQVLSRIQESFGVELPLRSMFDHPTVAGLAEEVLQKGLERADADMLARLLAELEGSLS
jgi:amino acid adenylation domain-containing protein